MLSSKDKSGRLVKNTVIIGLGSIASRGIILIMAPFFSRWLSVEDYGAFDLVTTYVSLLLPFCTLSIAEAAFRFLLDDIDDRDRMQIISSSLLLSTIGYILFLLIYSFISIASGRLTFNWLLSLLLFAQILHTYFLEIARGLKKMGLYSLFSFISVVLLALLSTWFLLEMKMGLNGIVLGYSIAYIVSSFGLGITTGSFKFISWREVSLYKTKEMLGYSWPLIPNSISWWVVNVSDRLIIKNFIGLAANGIYAVANKIPAIVNVLFSIFHISWVQSASESVTDDDYQKFCNDVFNRLVPFIFSSAAGLISCNFIIYNFVFDSEKYHSAYYYSPILIMAAAISCVGQFVGGIMIAKKKTKQNGATNMIAAFSNVIINLFLVNKYGLYAASISTLLAYIIMVVLRIVLVRQYVRLRINRFGIIVILISLLIFIGVYFNNSIINVIILCLATVFFVITNKKLIISSFRVIVKR